MGEERPERNSHCSFCGEVFVANTSWPRRCEACESVSYINPIPVAVVLQPVDGGVLTIRRDIEPKRGMLALPGGFMDYGESWQEAAARELMEEAEIEVAPQDFELVTVESPPDGGTVLIFVKAPTMREQDLPEMEGDHEVSEHVVVREPTELAFSLHTEVLRAYFEES